MTENNEENDLFEDELDDEFYGEEVDLEDEQSEDGELEEDPVEEYLHDREKALERLQIKPKDEDAAKDLIITDACLCEEYTKLGGQTWRIPSLCKEILRHLPIVESSLPSYRYKDEPKEFEELKKGIVIYNVATRSTATLFRHPRLKLRILSLALVAMRKMRMQDFPTWHTHMEEMSKEIKQLHQNIQFADAGEFDKIQSTKRLKTDPVEWTETFENVIALAEEKADAKLRETHCGGVVSNVVRWKTLQQILLNDYGIQWRHPAQLNPGVRFD